MFVDAWLFIWCYISCYALSLRVSLIKLVSVYNMKSIIIVHRLLISKLSTEPQGENALECVRHQYTNSTCRAFQFQPIYGFCELLPEVTCMAENVTPGTTFVGLSECRYTAPRQPAVPEDGNWQWVTDPHTMDGTITERSPLGAWRYATTVACHCFYYHFRVSIAPPPSLYKEGAGRWKHENDNKNSDKRLCMPRVFYIKACICQDSLKAVVFILLDHTVLHLPVNPTSSISHLTTLHTTTGRLLTWEIRHLLWLSSAVTGQNTRHCISWK